jgi:polyvinyl alcohol dehydrogenase (cytochrome)
MPSMLTRGALVAAVVFVASTGLAANAGPDGAALYAERCAKCHDHAQGHMPTRDSLTHRPAINIVMTLKTGSMRPQAEGLSQEEVRAIADFLSASAPKPVVRANRCSAPAQPLRLSPTGWSGWSADLSNSRFQPHSGLAPDTVPRLKLKWAFAYPSPMSWGQPTVVGGRVFITSTTGQLYALDAQTGCTVWALEDGAPVRTPVSIGPGVAGHNAIAYFGDISAVAHAVDADTGVEVWHARVDEHAMARITGAPVLFHDRLLVPVSSFEEGAAAQANYACCTFRGSVVALDAKDGRLMWKRFTISEPLKPYQRTGEKTGLFGPAGGAVWGAPAIDTARGVLYVGTGNDYTDISTAMTDAVLAISLTTGDIVWAHQLVPGDNWAAGCSFRGPCPTHSGPDADFAAPTILVKLSSGHDVLIAGQKSGVVYGLDPDARGKVLWRTSVGVGGIFGGIEWGMAASGNNVYVPISDSMPNRESDAPRSGIGTLDAATGKVLWWTAASPPVCNWGTADCRSAHSQAVTAINGIVFSGSQDGHLRAYDTHTGKIIWDFDTARTVPAVNADSASGGSLDAGGPVVVEGVLYVNSGYGQFLGHAGNVLLALSVDGK